MNRSRVQLLASVCAVTLLTLVMIAPAPAAAAESNPITIRFTAQVSDLFDYYGKLGGVIHEGDIIHGEYTYDATTPDANPENNVAEYDHTSWPYGMTVWAGGFVFQTDPNNVNFNIYITNNGGAGSTDYYSLWNYTNLPLSNGISVDYISWELRDSSGTALSSDALPTTALNLAHWQYNYLRIEGEDADYVISARVTAVEQVTRFAITGFYHPVDMGTLNTVKAGSSVPLKFEVFDGNTEVKDPNKVAVAVTSIACPRGEPRDEVEITTNNPTGLRYVTSAGQFVYDWKTPKTPGQCYRVTVKSVDASIAADFQLR